MRSSTACFTMPHTVTCTVLQYQTLRIPSQCFLQSVPQTIYQT